MAAINSVNPLADMNTSQSLETALHDFRSSSREDREQFLCELLTSLHPSERSLVYRSLLNKGFGYDILGNLPLEVVLKVIVFFEARELFLFRSVCKRWQRILSSESVINVGLRRWFPRETDISKLLSTSGPNRLSSLRNLAFREHAAASGLLLAGGEVLIPEKQGDEEIRSIVLRADIMATVTSKRLLVLDMDSIVSPRTFLTPSRETVAYAAVGPSHVVALTFHFGTCHVWNLQGEHIYKWRLTSGNIQNLEVSEKHVVALSTSISEICFHILDIKSLRSSSFLIPCSGMSPDEIYLLYSTKQTVFVDDDKNQVVLVRAGYSETQYIVSVTRICCELGTINFTQVTSKDIARYEAPNYPTTIGHWHSVHNPTEGTITYMPHGGDLVSCHYSVLHDSLSWATWDIRRLKQDLGGDNVRPLVSTTNAACHGMVAFTLVERVPTRSTPHSQELVVARDTTSQRYDYENGGNQGDRRIWKRCRVTSTNLEKITVDEILGILFNGRFLIFATGASILVFEAPDYDTYISTVEKAK